MPLTLEPPAEQLQARTGDYRLEAPVALSDILPEVLAALLSSPRPAAEVLRVPSRERTGRALRLVG